MTNYKNKYKEAIEGIEKALELMQQEMVEGKDIIKAEDILEKLVDNSIDNKVRRVIWWG